MVDRAVRVHEFIEKMFSPWRVDDVLHIGAGFPRNFRGWGCLIKAVSRLNESPRDVFANGVKTFLPVVGKTCKLGFPEVNWIRFTLKSTHGGK